MDLNNNIVKENHIEYDDNITSERIINKNDTTKIKSEYDSKNRQKTIIVNDVLGTDEYENIDEKGNWRKRVAFMNKEKNMITIRNIKYRDNSNLNKEPDNEQKYEMAKIKSLSSVELETKCFLGFDFTMSEDDVMSHLKKLLADKTVYADYNQTYAYNFIMEDGTEIYVNFSSEYYNNRLCRMRYTLRSSRIKEDLSGLLYSAFINDDKEKEINTFEVKSINSKPFYTYIKDNLKVIFKENEMIYENAPAIQKEKEEKYLTYIEKEQLSKEKAKESYSQF